MLRTESATLGYPGRPVLEGVTLEIHPGEVVALIGPNGAGKSTLIRAASGVLRTSAGRIAVDGVDVAGLAHADRAKRVAVVPQGAQVPEAFGVLETVRLGRTAYQGWLGRESRDDESVVRESIERTQTRHLEARRLGELSGGERQLVLIARALAQKAQYLLLDEPTAHLDLRHEALILELVKDLAHRDGLGVLVALHDLNLAARHADRVALLAGGRLRAVGPPTEILTEKALSDAYGVPVSIFRDPSCGSPVIFAAFK